MGGGRDLTVTRVLVSTGREPDLDRLDLAAGDVEVDARSRPVLDRFLRSTSNPRVWVAGDAAGGMQFTPVADLEGEAVARSIVNGEPHAPDLSLVPSTCFTIPEVARVGLREAELAARGAPYQVARGDFEWVAQAIISGRRGGLIKLLADAEGRLLGAHLAGQHAGDLIYVLALAARAGAALADLQMTRAVHPTLAEALNWASFNVESVTP
jgi:pyruvate/2-oxoglutarate dehydrogenase complex dihydrolipoamide dehydrogenase (E3) component